MTRVAIIVEVESEHADDNDATGLTSTAYERLTEPMQGPLDWLGEVQEVKQA